MTGSWALVAVVPIAVCCSGAHPAGPVSREPNPQVTIHPPVALCVYGSETMELRLRLPETGDRWRCPRLTVDWGDGCKSSVTADCEPDEIAARTVRRRHVYYGCGEFTVVVRLHTPQGEWTGSRIFRRVQ